MRLSGRIANRPSNDCWGLKSSVGNLAISEMVESFDLSSNFKQTVAESKKIDPSKSRYRDGETIRKEVLKKSR